MRMQSIKSNNKKFISRLLVVGGLIFSMNVNAVEPSIESEVTAYVVEQSKQLIEVMANELKQTIADEINQFSILSALPWPAEEETKVSNINNKTITKKSAE